MINSDEIFAKEQPILVTIEPYSMAILRMELTTSRTADDWKQYWTSIKHEGIEIGGLCSDQGKGIIKGFSDFNPKLPIFPDHFYHFRALVHKVEKGAFNDAIKALREERRLPNCWNREAADQDVTLYDDHHYLLQCILEILPFLSDQGEFQDPECLAWSHERQAVLSSGKPREYHLSENKFWLEYVETSLKSDYINFKELTFRWLDSIPRASSLVEAINSMPRPYLNVVKGKITQPMLNLILYYHNHRPFAGEEVKLPWKSFWGKL